MNSRSSKAGNPFSLLLKKILTSEYYILVSDRFDESLLILEQFLGLEVSDLLYKKQKVTPIDQLIVLSEAQQEVLLRYYYFIKFFILRIVAINGNDMKYTSAGSASFLVPTRFAFTVAASSLSFLIVFDRYLI